MKRILFIFIFLTILFDLSPLTESEIKNVIPSEVKTMLLNEVNIVSTHLEKPVVPESYIPDYIFDKQLYVESRLNHFKLNDKGELKLIESPAGAVGIAQFLPSTWEWLKTRKVLPKDFSIERESHQRVAQRLYMNYLAKKRYGIRYNRIKLALASYNAGSGRVGNLIKAYGLEWEKHLPNETKKYIKIIIG